MSGQVGMSFSGKSGILIRSRSAHWIRTLTFDSSPSQGEGKNRTKRRRSDDERTNFDNCDPHRVVGDLENGH